MDFSDFGLDCIQRYVFGSGGCPSGNFTVTGDVLHTLQNSTVKFVGFVLIGVPLAAFFVRALLRVFHV